MVLKKSASLPDAAITLTYTTDISPRKSWDILRAPNPDDEGVPEFLPVGDMDDPCERGIELLTNKPPFDKKEVRWALALATNISDVSLAKFGGALRVSVLPVPPVTVLQNAYHKPMRDWLANFTLPDGFKPYNADFATEFAKKMSDQGIEGIPSDPAGAARPVWYGLVEICARRGDQAADRGGFQARR